MHKEVILVVDDDPFFIDLISDCLQHQYDIKTVMDADEALQAAVTSPKPDLILQDISMPGRNGYQLCQAYKSIPAVQDIPVIFISALESPEDIKKGFDVGAVDFVNKPIIEEILLSRIDTHLKIAQQRIIDKKKLQHQAREIEEAQCNEKITKAIFDATSPIIIVSDSGIITQANAAFCRMSGYAKSELVGQAAGILKSGLQNDEFYRELWASLNEQDFWVGEIYNKRKNGDIFPARLNISVIRSSHSDSKHYIATYKDLSLQKAYIENIEQSSNEDKVISLLLHQALSEKKLKDYLDDSLRQFIGNVPWLSLLPKAAIMLTEQKEYKSLRLFTQLNLSSEQIVFFENGKFGDCLYEKTATHKKQQYDSCMDNNNSIAIGVKISHQYYTIPILFEDRVLGVLALFLLDSHQFIESERNFLKKVANVLSLGISNRLKSDALIKANSELAQANQLKSQFLSNINHEIKTPMNIIQGNLNNLFDSINEKVLKKNISQALKGYERLENILNNIFYLNKLSDNQYESLAVKFRLDNIINNFVNFLSRSAKQKELAIEVNTGHRNNVLFGDLASIDRILRIFGENAVKFSRPGGTITLHVEIVYLNQDSVQLTLKVSDTGIGIEKDKLKMLFVDFMQADTSTTRSYEGLGIGLAIANKLSDVLPGRLLVESVPRQGSTFGLQVNLKQIACDEKLIIQRDFDPEKTKNAGVSEQAIVKTLDISRAENLLTQLCTKLNSYDINNDALLIELQDTFQATKFEKTMNKVIELTEIYEYEKSTMQIDTLLKAIKSSKN